MFSVNTDVGPLIAKTALAAVAATLLCAGLYGLWGKPRTNEGKKRKYHIVHGFQVGGGILLGIVLMGSLVAGSQIAFGVVPATRLSRGVGFSIATASFLLIFLLIRLWAKYFAGWIGYSIFNGLLMISTGHLVNNPSIAVPRWWSILNTVLVFVSALVCVRFTDTKSLSRIDKAALMLWLLMFTAAMDIDSTHALYRREIASVVMFLGCLALVLAWFYDRRIGSHNRAKAGHVPRSHGTADSHLA